MSELNTDIRYIKGVGEVRAKAFFKAGVCTLEDLLNYFPRDYEDRTKVKSIQQLSTDETVCIKAMVATEHRLAHIRQGMDLVKLRAVDDTGGVEITFFNMPYIKNSIVKGETYYFFGKVSGVIGRFTMTNPVVESENSAKNLTRRIVPVYPLRSGLTQNIVSNAIRQGLRDCGENIPDLLPPGTAEKYQLARPGFAYENIHFPEDENSLEIARKRLVFEEFFLFAAAVSMLRLGGTDKKSPPLKQCDITEFLAAVPFELTGAQKRAVDDVISDMSGERSMSRLIQGDVGSGKTIVAAAALWMTAKNGYQAAFMAPTEILAEQHCRSLTPLLTSLGISCVLLTGSMGAKKKRDVLSKIESGEADVIIGTHALISETVKYRDLGLVVTDEQHRFGVVQRASLADKGKNPHVLVMSATPIPRTLALILYGDLDVSVIDELPPGRQNIDTFAVTEKMRSRINAFTEKLISEGRQVYIVCPMVEDSDAVKEDVKAATAYTEKLKNEVFPDRRIALVHGKMKPKDKDDVMRSFADGDIDILVATTVIEVGVDVPNAALIIIENAERFGLSQLHQLRGRVGRGKHKSYCVMFSGGGETAAERLKTMCDTNDGFKIAEADLSIRGPGDFLGVRQCGLPQMHIADMASDMEVMKIAQNEAKAVLASDPLLQKPEHAQLSKYISKLLEKKISTIN